MSSASEKQFLDRISGMEAKMFLMEQKLSRVSRALEERGSVLSAGQDFFIVADGGLDTDIVVIGGRKVTVPENTNGKRYLQVNLDGSGGTWVDSMPDVSPEGTETYDTWKNHIHITGAFAPGG